jgi:SAM-dependent methyltransferase
MSQLAEHLAPSLAVADGVRDFYERYPYPPPVHSLEGYQWRWQDRQRRRADYHLFWPGRSYREDHSILIAGCGTSQAAKHAMRWPGTQITAIDCSSTSVQSTNELKRKYNLKNLQVQMLAIERVNELETRFDQIVCTGVLHHLADPDSGLRALRSVLKADGAMQLMVYAPYGRAGVYMLQDFCRRIGIDAAASDAAGTEIKNLMAALAALPPGHPLESLLRQSPDFRHEAALADALLHPQDRAYSVPQLFEFIENAGLTFGRWLKQAPYSVHCGIMAQIPQAGRITRLPAAEQYAAIELFRGTMARHSVVVYRDDCPDDLRQVSFVDDAWRNYVPIRMADTICVQDRLPEGAKGVVINQTHTYRDLFLPLKSAEKRLFDAIDGVLSIGEIETAALSDLERTNNPGMAQDFFETLWWHDQVVFDASR